MEKFNLYDEPRAGTYTDTKTTISKDSPINIETMIEMDISYPETLFTMSKKVRDFLSDKPDDYQMTLYLVCGNIPSVDAGLFANYLKDVSQPILIAFRGIIHFDFIHLFINNTVHISSDCSIMYSKVKLHDTMKNLLIKPDSYKRFMQRFVDVYWELTEGNLLPSTELDAIGIKIESL